MIGQPTCDKGESGIENIVQNIESNGDACRFGFAERGTKFLGSKQNQKRVCEVPCSEEADSDEKAPYEAGSI